MSEGYTQRYLAAVFNVRIIIRNTSCPVITLDFISKVIISSSFLLRTILFISHSQYNSAGDPEKEELNGVLIRVLEHAKVICYYNELYGTGSPLYSTSVALLKVGAVQLLLLMYLRVGWNSLLCASVVGRCNKVGHIIILISVNCNCNYFSNCQCHYMQK